jgi:hypothetical protein
MAAPGLLRRIDSHFSAKPMVDVDSYFKVEKRRDRSLNGRNASVDQHGSKLAPQAALPPRFIGLQSNTDQCVMYSLGFLHRIHQVDSALSERGRNSRRMV